MVKRIENCRVCQNSNLVPILDLGEQCLTGVFPRDRSEPITRGPLELVKCCGNSVCGLVQLHDSYDLSEMYGMNYGYRSSLNQSMVRHLEGKVRALLQRFPVADGDLVLDIGSNDGTLLSFYPRSLLSVGMDPTATKFRQFYQPHIQVIPDFFSAETFESHFGGKKAKIITSVSMFYDLEDPIAFVKQIASVMHDEGVWHFEQSHMPTMLRQNAYDTVCHEHLEYYGLHQIQWMMERCGLKIVDVELNDVNGGSFAVTAAKVDSLHPVNSTAVFELLEAERKEQLDTLAPYEAFRGRVFRHRDELRDMLDDLRRKGSTILGYGASTKGNVILQFCGITKEQLPSIAEVNPDKVGCVTPGTHIPIVSELDARALKPDYFLAMPWHFRDNLVNREADYLNRGGKMIFPLPGIEIVGR
jgi:hypothetical protein